MAHLTRPFLLSLIVSLFTINDYRAQDFSIEKEESEKSDQNFVVDQQRVYVIPKMRPIAMVFTPVTWSVLRNINLEVEVPVSPRFTLGVGFNYFFFGSNALVDEDSVNADISSDLYETSIRLEGKYYFNKKKAKSDYYYGEGFYLGAYTHLGFARLDFFEASEVDIRSFQTILGGLAGYQIITSSKLAISPFVGLGLGLGLQSDGFLGILIDPRAGLSFGYAF